MMYGKMKKHLPFNFLNLLFATTLFAGDYSSDSLAVVNILKYSKVEQIYHQHNYYPITEIDSISQIKNGRITSLNLNTIGSGKFRELSPEIANLDSLEILIISGVTRLPEEISQLQNLKQLHLWANPKSLPESFGQLKKLKTLTIGPYFLVTNTYLPDEICELDSLSWLEVLPGSRPLIIPACIDNLQQLRVLDLSDNKLSELPSQVFNLSNLVKLDLSSNSFTELSRMIDELNALVDLDVSNNMLAELPKEVENLTYLRELWVRDNPLNTLPKGLMALDSLWQVRVDGSLCGASDSFVVFLNERNARIDNSECPTSLHPVVERSFTIQESPYFNLLGRKFPNNGELGLFRKNKER